MHLKQRWIIAFSILLFIQTIAVPPVLADGPEENCTVDTSGRCIIGELSAIELRALEAEIDAYPSPNVTPIAIDETLLSNRNYQRVLQQVTIYDSPNGNPVGTLDPGFNFFTTINRSGNWIEVNPGQWVEEEYLGGARVSRFTGVELNAPPVFPVGHQAEYSTRI